MSIEEVMGVVRLEDCCQLFGLSPEKAKEKARTGELPVPAFHLGSTKSPWYVSQKRLKDYAIACDKQAEGERRAVNGE